MLLLIKRHFLAIFFAIVIGASVVAPTISSIITIGIENFKGIYPMWIDDEQAYLARSEKVLQGNISLGNPYYAEYEKETFLQPPVAEMISIIPAKVFAMSVPMTYTVYDFLLPFSGVLLLYILLLFLTDSIFLSAFFSFTFYVLFLFNFGRPINPQLNFVLLYVGLLAVWYAFFKKEAIRRRKIFASVSLGGIFSLFLYISPYYWTTLGAICFFSVLLLWRYKKDTSVLVWVVSFFGIVCIGAIPYLFFTFHASKLPYYAESIVRFGLFNSHWPADFTNVSFLILPTAVLWFIRKQVNTTSFLYGLSLLLGAFAINYQNVITGTYLQFSSHYYQITILLVWIVLAIIVSGLESSFQKQNIGFWKQKFIPLLLVFLLTVAIAVKQWNTVSIALLSIDGASQEEMSKLQSEKEVFDWFNANTEQKSVVYILADYDGRFPIYTHNYVYYNYYGGLYLLPQEQQEERWMRQHLFDTKMDESFILDHQTELFGSTYVDVYQNWLVRQRIKSWFGVPIPEREMVPSAVIIKALNQYKETKKEDPLTAIKKYRVDYFLVDTTIETGKNANEYLFKNNAVSELKRFGNLRIYEITK